MRQKILSHYFLMVTKRANLISLSFLHLYVGIPVNCRTHQIDAYARKTCVRKEDGDNFLMSKS